MLCWCVLILFNLARLKESKRCKHQPTKLCLTVYLRNAQLSYHVHLLWLWKNSKTLFDLHISIKQHFHCRSLNWNKLIYKPLLPFINMELLVPFQVSIRLTYRHFFFDHVHMICIINLQIFWWKKLSSINAGRCFRIQQRATLILYFLRLPGSYHIHFRVITSFEFVKIFFVGKQLYTINMSKTNHQTEQTCNSLFSLFYTRFKC